MNLVTPTRDDVFGRQRNLRFYEQDRIPIHDDNMPTGVDLSQGKPYEVNIGGNSVQLVGDLRGNLVKVWARFDSKKGRRVRLFPGVPVPGLFQKLFIDTDGNTVSDAPGSIPAFLVVQVGQTGQPGVGGSLEAPYIVEHTRGNNFAGGNTTLTEGGTEGVGIASSATNLPGRKLQELWVSNRGSGLVGVNPMLGSLVTADIELLGCIVIPPGNDPRPIPLGNFNNGFSIAILSGETESDVNWWYSFYDERNDD